MKSLTTSEDLKELYEKDFYLWVYENLRLLREGKYDQVDWEHLLEEIEDMGISERKSLRSYIEVILEHIYKLDSLRRYSKYDTDIRQGGRGWEKSIINASRKVNVIVRDNPSLLQHLEDITRDAWEIVRGEIMDFIKFLEMDGIIDSKTKRELLRNIPEELPYTMEEIADRITELTEDDNNAFAQYIRKYKKGQKPGEP